MLTTYIKDAIKESCCISTDLDKTLIGSRVAEASFSLIKNEITERHYSNVARGIIEGLGIYVGTALLKRWGSSELEAENWGLQTLHKVLNDTKIRKETIQKIAKEYIGKHEMPGARNCLQALRNFGEPKKVIIYTRSGSIFAEPAARFFGADDYISNRTIYMEERFVNNAQILIRSPENLLDLVESKLKEHDLELKDSLVIGDSEPDTVFKGHVKAFLASPKAKEKVRRIADFSIEDYRIFGRQIRKLQQEMQLEL